MDKKKLKFYCVTTLRTHINVWYLIYIGFFMLRTMEMIVLA